MLKPIVTLIISIIIFHPSISSASIEEEIKLIQRSAELLRRKAFRATIEVTDEYMQRFPAGIKTSSIYLVKASALIGIKDEQRAAALLQKLVEDYPKSQESIPARQILKSLGGPKKISSMQANRANKFVGNARVGGSVVPQKKVVAINGLASSNDPYQMLREGGRAVQEGKYEKAEEIFNSIVANSSDPRLLATAKNQLKMLKSYNPKTPALTQDKKQNQELLKHVAEENNSVQTPAMLKKRIENVEKLVMKVMTQNASSYNPMLVSQRIKQFEFTYVNNLRSEVVNITRHISKAFSKEPNTHKAFIETYDDYHVLANQHGSVLSKAKGMVMRNASLKAEINELSNEVANAPRIFVKKFQSTGIDEQKVIDEMNEIEWSATEKNQVIKKYYPRNLNEGGIPIAITALLSEAINNSDENWRRLPSNSTAKKLAAKVIKALEPANSQQEARQLLWDGKFYPGYGLNQLPGPVLLAIKGADDRGKKRKSEAFKKKQEKIASRTNKTPINYRGMVIGKTTKNEAIRAYAQRINNARGLKGINITDIFSRDSIDLLRKLETDFLSEYRDLFEQLETVVVANTLSDLETEMICFQPRGLNNRPASRSDCLFIKENILVGFMTDLSQTNCQSRCSLFTKEFKSLATYGFSTVSSNVTEKSEWYELARPKEKLLAASWGSSGVTKKQTYGTVTNWVSEFSLNARLCVFINSIQTQLADEELYNCPVDKKYKSLANNMNETRPTIKDCDDCPELVKVSKGRFRMGSNTDSGSAARPAHQVTINKNFAVAKYEVTYETYDVYTESEGLPRTNEYESRRGKHPVNVTWTDAVKYLEWLNKKSGMKYRLLSEAEWEYALRGGTRSATYYGDESEQCEYENATDLTISPKGQQWEYGAKCTDGYFFTAPVGSFKPNPYGLYDMGGNAREWVQDCFVSGYADAPTDGSAKTTDCSNGRDRRGKVQRGGQYNTDFIDMRSASRRNGASDDQAAIRIGRDSN
jgi:formylglycine-generating enzyme required for sulfatase activity